MEKEKSGLEITPEDPLLDHSINILVQIPGLEEPLQIKVPGEEETSTNASHQDSISIGQSSSETLPEEDEIIAEVLNTFEKRKRQSSKSESPTKRSKKTCAKKKRRAGDSPVTSEDDSEPTCSSPEDPLLEKDPLEPESSPWSHEEDYVLLKSLKEVYEEETFVKISNTLTSRSVDEVKKRFRILYSLMQKFVE